MPPYNKHLLPICEINFNMRFNYNKLFFQIMNHVNLAIHEIGN
jgi:hypothetical protein